MLSVGFAALNAKDEEAFGADFPSVITHDEALRMMTTLFTLLSLYAELWPLDVTFIRLMTSHDADGRASAGDDSFIFPLC
jgi:hypothetical protein